MHVLLCPVGSHGDVHPFVGLGRGLKARGHRVTLVTAAPFRGLAAANGFDDFAPVGTDQDYHDTVANADLWRPSRALRVIFDPVRMARMMRDGYRHVADRYAPGQTVAVAGTLAFATRVAQDRLGVPVATVHLQPGVLPSVENPPVLAHVRLGRWPRWVRRLAYRFGDRLVMDRLLGRPVNALRREVGLPPVRSVFGRWLNSPQRAIGLFPAWYGSAPDWPPQFRQTGFIRYDQADRDLPPGLGDFLAAGEPPVVFSFGSAMRVGRQYFEAAVGACQLGNFRGLLLAKGGDQIPADLPPNVAHFDYAPFSRVFPRAKVVVHHGGIGTTAQALAAGVPQVVMPLAFDQPDNADRVQRLGVGTALPPKRLTPATVVEAVAKLTDPKVAAACREVAAKMAADDPLSETCRLIEELRGTDRRSG